MTFLSYAYKVDGKICFGSAKSPDMIFEENFSNFEQQLKDATEKATNIEMDENSFCILGICPIPSKKLIQTLNQGGPPNAYQN